MIKIENLVHKYTIWKDENIKSEKTVLDGISLDIPSGQFVAILGPNGSGKSTLAKHLNVLLLPNEGTVWIDGKDTHAKERLWEIRSQVGMVFQNPDNQIIGTSVEEDVAFGPENKNIEPEKIRKIVETVLRKVKLWDRRKASPSILSGGQKQRLATADALAGLPACLVLDEPTAMLDPDSRKEVINIVKELNRKEGMTIILITHHTDEVVDADRIVLMKDGKIIGDDIPKKIFADYELLKKTKMDIPPVVELGMRLEKQQIGLEGPVLQEQEMIEKIVKLYRSKCGGKKDAAR
jgi:energy-coupling factor transport system ATP-binding protein